MLRTGCDLRTEFSSSDELRRYRDAYILHVLDYVLQDRERVHFNDQRKYLEMNKDKITLDNVFQLAKAQRDRDDDSEEEEEEEEKSDIDTPDEEPEEEEPVQDGKKKKRKPTKPAQPLELPECGYLKAATTDFFATLPTQD
jgi:hypothetical protein